MENIRGRILTVSLLGCLDEFSDGDLNNSTFITVTYGSERKVSILPGYGGEDWMGPTPSKSAICRDPATVWTFGEGCIFLRYMSALEIYVCSAHFENRDPCTMGTWVNLFWEISP